MKGKKPNPRPDWNIEKGIVIIRQNRQPQRNDGSDADNEKNQVIGEPAHAGRAGFYLGVDFLFELPDNAGIHPGNRYAARAPPFFFSRWGIRLGCSDLDIRQRGKVAIRRRRACAIAGCVVVFICHVFLVTRLAVFRNTQCIDGGKQAAKAA